jgi:hypothetical protein
MAECETANGRVALDLPPVLEAIEGLIEADIDAIARAIATRAHEQMFLGKQPFRELFERVRRGIVNEINLAVADLRVESR